MSYKNAENMKSGKTLFVSELIHGNESAEETSTECRMEYEFTDDTSPNGLSAWQGDGVVKVNRKCRSFNGVYRQQALNRLFAKLILKKRPDLVVISGLNGASLDLIRVASMMGATVFALVTEPFPDELGEGERIWLSNCLASASKVYVKSSELESGLNKYCNTVAGCWPKKLSNIEIVSNRTKFDYGIYEFCLRDHPLLMTMQEQDVDHFKFCNNVLDLGCGAGLFLQLLKEKGISAYGVERDKTVAAYGRDTGLDIICDDAMNYLQENEALVDGIYCSHFVEHLPIEAVELLIAGVAKRLSSNGVAVFTFPDPESIRSQLLGFWRDPEHVRFYHPELIKTIAAVHGLECEWSSYDEQQHSVYPFTAQPEPLKCEEPINSALPPLSTKKSWWLRLLSAFGVITQPDVADINLLKTRLHNQQLIIEQLAQRTEKLWQVNQTWAWNDNVTIRFRKCS